MRAGDYFLVEDSPETQAVTLRKVKGREDWFEVYLQCPHAFEVPPRRRQLYARKHELAPDSFIAATARRHNLTIATRNVADYVRPGLRTLNPVASVG
jgi:predicted nucleic acid-binding protein